MKQGFTNAIRPFIRILIDKGVSQIVPAFLMLFHHPDLDRPQTLPDLPVFLMVFYPGEVEIKIQTFLIVHRVSFPDKRASPEKKA
jgi:hypothetical protein